MFTRGKKLAAGTFLALSLLCQLAPVASAQGYFYYNPYYRPGVFTTHPILSSTLLGTAIGAAGGAAIGAMDQNHDGSGNSNIVPGAAIGAGTGAALGAGVGMIRNRYLYGTWF